MKRTVTKLSYANVASTLALFVALGGGAYAALRVDSGDIVDNSVRGRDIHNGTVGTKDVGRNTIRGSDIAESSLHRVPRARLADGLTEAGAAQLKLRCPPRTQFAAGECFESQPHTPSRYSGAVRGCGGMNGSNGHLPTHAQLVAFQGNGGTIDPGGELTANVGRDPSQPGGIEVLVLQGTGDIGFVTGNDARAYRCVVVPTNR